MGCTRNSSDPSSVVTVYSSRADHLIKPIFDLYQERTGQEVRFLTDSEGPLMERLKAEGANSPADLFLTVDAGNLWKAAEEGLLRPIQSKKLEQAIPAHLRDPENQWFGLSLRARTILYSPERVSPSDLSTYEALADEAWAGRLCMRTSRKVYNQSLVAALIAHHGQERAEQIVGAWVRNLATEVFPNDTDLIRAIAAGQCDVGIANSYYFGRLLRDQPDFPVRLFWASLENSGTHLNVSGAGVTRHAKNPEGAQALLEWLTEPEAQKAFAELNLEYPIVTEVARDPIVEGWGSFQGDLLNLRSLGELQTQAVQLMDRVQYR
ncbi:MAG: Fe(3+) ABC transporter substrate-binding protein [Bradymonadales bacterium]|nr:MAG: Fe(3+) ABC transporter substrate-binding protein [Bradymonadales bacterium]